MAGRADEEWLVRQRFARVAGAARGAGPGRQPGPTTHRLPGPEVDRQSGGTEYAGLDEQSGPRPVPRVAAEIGPSVGHTEPGATGALPAALTAAAFDPGRRGLRALVVLAVLVLASAAAVAWLARPRAEPVGPGPAATTGTVVAAGESPSAVIVVAVAGRVRQPGLVRLPAGARVADAVEAAGGLLPGTDLTTVNLARRLTDGELVVVGVAGSAAPGAAGTGPPGAGGKVNLNTATLAQLDSLPGVGPVLAQRILDYRDQHGGFRSITDLRHVDGIGDARFDELKDLVTL
jgi:competence protein ComEA